jgi:hypothetical protein
MMGEAPSFAVLQTAYLEALDQFIDYNEHDNLPAYLSPTRRERRETKKCLGQPEDPEAP